MTTAPSMRERDGGVGVLCDEHARPAGDSSARGHRASGLASTELVFCTIVSAVLRYKHGADIRKRESVHPTGEHYMRERDAREAGARRRRGAGS